MKHTSEPWPWRHERYSSPWGLREPAATLAPTPKLPADCSRPLEASWLMYRRSCSGVMPVPVSVTVTLRTLPAEAVEPRRSMSHTTRPRRGPEPGDCVEPVHRQLAQALKVAAFAAEAFEQEGGVGD